MKSLRCILLHIALLTCAINMIAQPTVEIPWQEQGVWPQSPQARAISQVMMPSPALLTGACEFSVPLYTISASAINIPVTLQYRSNGIRVDDDPQPIGYGWTLTPPLRVSRQIRGRADEMYSYRSETFDATYELDYGSVREEKCGSPYGRDSVKLNDPEHDIYTVYLLDKTLTVMRNHETGEFVGVDIDEYKIESDRILTSISVTDPQGCIYDFSTIGEYQQSYINRTEWLLSAITLPSGERIKIGWCNNEHIGHGMTFFGPKTVTFGVYPPTFRVESEPRDGARYKNHSSFNTHDLSYIEFPGGRMDCTYDKSHTYYTMLTRVSVVNSDGESVFNAALTHANTGVLLSEVSIDGTGVYSFKYNSQGFTFPDGQDWWGFYNDKPNDRVLAPAIRLCERPDSTVRSFVDIEGADRSVDTTAMRANILEMATMPTGAVIKWDYEPHRFDFVLNELPQDKYIEIPELTYGGGLRVKTISIGLSPDDTHPRIRSYEYGINNDGKAVVEALPTLNTFVKVDRLLQLRYYFGDYMLYDQDYFVTINRQSNYLQDLPGLQSIWYDKVTEYEQEGKTEYFFENIVEKSTTTQIQNLSIPSYIRTVFSKGPQLTKTICYKEENDRYIPVTTTENKFEKIQGEYQRAFSSYRVERLLITLGNVDSPDYGLNEYTDFELLHYLPGEPPDGGGIKAYRNDIKDWFASARYFTEPVYERLAETTTTEHTATGDIAQRTSYNYIDKTSLVNTITQTLGSEAIKTNIEYAINDKNACEVASAAPGTVMAKTMSYGSASWGYKNNIIMSGRMPLIESIDIIRGSYSHIGAHYTYSDRGRLLTNIGPDNIITSFAWDEKQLYPVSQTVGNHLTSLAQWRGLVGVTCLTSPNGLQNNFAYDGAGHLISQSIFNRKIASYDYRINHDGYNCVTTKTYTSEANGYTSVTRYDALGRAWATLTQTPENWIAVMTEYDGMGRSVRHYAPAPVEDYDATAGSIRMAASYFHKDSQPYSETYYETSPREMVIAQTGIGEIALRSGLKTYTMNITNDSKQYKCPFYKISTDGVVLDGYYPAGTLNVNVTTNEDGVTTTSYTDMRGLCVCSVIGNAYTNYVYDDYGQLRYVLPPGCEGSHKRTDSDMQNLAFIYDYDERGRCTSKKIPGAEVELMLYDPADRLVAVHNGYMNYGTWRLFGYDKVGRMVLQLTCGITDEEASDFASCVRTASLNSIKREYDYGGYTLTPEPVAWPGNADWAKYYDDYEFLTVRGLDNNFRYSGGVLYNNAPSGQQTGMYTGAGHEAYYYNGMGQEIQRYATGYNKGRRFSVYNYDGSLASESFVYPDNSSIPEMTRTYSYDSVSRPVGSEVSLPALGFADLGIMPLGLSDSEIVVATNTKATNAFAYDAIGRMCKIIHGNDRVATAFDYDVQSRLTAQYTTGISVSGALDYALSYTASGLVNNRSWHEGSYAYTYDNMQRLTAAKFTPSQTVNPKTDFSTTYAYDERGNILHLMRNGIIDRLPDGTEFYGLLDDLEMDYDGNRLTEIHAVSEALPFEGVRGQASQGDYSLSYNASGGLRTDSSRGILRIDRNADGLPTRYYLEGGHVITNKYDGLGRLMTVTYAESTRPVVTGQIALYTKVTNVRTYTGDGHILRRSKANGADTLQTVMFDGGYFDEEAGRAPRYTISDYLGSVTGVIDAKGNPLQANTYYPYGEPHRAPGQHRYLFGGKEYYTDHGLREYEFAARRGLPLLGRFDRPDPLTTDYPALSPYLYCAANPALLTDSTGCSFTGDIQQLEEYIKFLHDQLEACVTILQSETDINGLSGFAKNYQATLKKCIDEYYNLKKSDVEYNFREIEELENEGYNLFDASNNRIIIAVPKTADKKKFSLIAHEIHHGKQFENGEISYLLSGAPGDLYDITDEKDAYHIQNVIHKGVFYYNIEHPEEDIQYLRTSLGYATLPMLKRNLKNYSKNLSTFENSGIINVTIKNILKIKK